jgi:hypothetical protein
MSNRAVVTITGHADRERVATWAKNVELGTIVEFRKKTRSHEQNAKLHAMLGEVAEQVVWYGRKLDATDWKHIFTASLRHADVVPGIDRGTVVPLGMRTSQMTIEEMGNLIELIYAFGADPAHPVTFKEPKEQNTETSDVPHDADVGSDAVDPSGVAPTLPADEADQPGGELEPPATSSSGSTTLSNEDKDNLLALIKRLKASIGDDETIVHITGQSFAAEGRKLSPLAAEKAKTLVKLFRAICRGERDKAEVIEEACGIAQVDILELGVDL